MDAMTFDPEAPLPGPPDPWTSTSQPGRRPGPPFHMTDMIAAEPALAARILARLDDPGDSAGDLARTVGAVLRAGSSVVVTGCGTSEHAALGVAAILGEAIGGEDGRRVAAAQAFELSLDPPTDGLVIGISHEGGTEATNAALAAARAAGARTGLITVSARAPGAAHADVVVETGELDQSWCHTVGYVSPLVAAAAIGAHLRSAAETPAVARGLLAAGLDTAAAAEGVAARLADADRILVIASGVDRVAGRELVLKIEEGTWIPAAYRDLETMLHGHLAATGEGTAIVLILADRARRAERLARARGALRAARVIGMEAAAIVATEAAAALPSDLTPAGRLLVPEAPGLPSPVAALLGTAVPLQLLTERLARARGVDPDPIHRDVDRYREAADAADESD